MGTDQVARDKISHALRTSVGASRRRQERRRQMRVAKQSQENKHMQQLAHSPLQSTHVSMQSSFASIPEAPPSHVWHGYSQTTDLHEYEPVLPVSSMVSFDSSVDKSDLWHTHLNRNDVRNFEPLPLSSLGNFSISTEMATSISQLLSDDDSH